VGTSLVIDWSWPFLMPTQEGPCEMHQVLPAVTLPPMDLFAFGPGFVVKLAMTVLQTASWHVHDQELLFPSVMVSVGF
jgi:hypothetical protein